MGFSHNLKRIREAKNISVDDICKQTGINNRTYRNYEKETWPPEENLKTIAHALNVSLNELIGYRNTKANELKPQDYCKQLSLKFDERNQDSYVITAKKSIIPQGGKVVIKKSDFVDIKQETKEKAAPGWWSGRLFKVIMNYSTLEKYHFLVELLEPSSA